MFNAEVVTSYANGTFVKLDANDALNFITGLAIAVIKDVKDLSEVEAEHRPADQDTMNLISEYMSGIPEAVRSSIIQTNVSILLDFVQDIVLNNTTRGLYLFRHVENRKTGTSPLDLVVKALEDAHQFYSEYGSDKYKSNKEMHVNRYNDDFMKLVSA